MLPMKIVIAGGSGRLGRHLIHRLRGDGHDVVQLVRRASGSENEITWDPYDPEPVTDTLAGTDIVINLAGAGVADRRWNAEYKELIHASRVIPTTKLAEGVADAGVPVMLNASATGWYGDTAGRLVDETTPSADDFLGRNCRDWENATIAAQQAGARVVFLRSGHVLAADAIIMKRLVPVVKFGLGGRFGSGEQYFPWISLLDWIHAVRHLLDQPVHGPVNLVGPTQATNAELVRALARLLHRPAPWVIPEMALRLVVGEAAVELTRGARVDAAVLRDSGYRFTHPTITDALAWAVHSR